MKILASLGLLALVPLAAHAGTWSDLWQRPDQQGEKALASGDPKAAASLFADPRRQAYAQLKAGDYAAAARRLAPFNDAESEYNRGNALARSGELSSSLAAYEATLKHANLDPALKRDAEHNRNLVEHQLQAQKQPQQGGKSAQSPAGQKDNQRSESNQSADASSSADSSNSQKGQASTSPKQPASASQGDSQKSQESAQNASPEQQAERSAAHSATEQGREDAKASSQPQSSLAQSSRPENEAKGEPKDGQPKDDKGESTGQASAQPMRPEDSKNASAALDEIPKSRTEQQLALDQWLRQIPDDPGGLLRRKFLIEHWMKQQQVQP